MKRIMHCGTSVLVPLLALFTACAVNEPSNDPPPVTPVPRQYPDKAIMQWAPFGQWDAATIEGASKATLVCVHMEQCFSPESRDVLAELRRLNPDIQVIGYQPLLSVVLLYPDTTYLRQYLPFALDYYYAVEDDWAWTTEGDTVLIWPEMVFLNPIKNGRINQELIDKIAGLIARYQTASGNAVDGIMHDFFMYDLWLNPTFAQGMIGKIDFDGDGIAFDDDPMERSLLMEWQLAYTRELRERLGNDFIQIGNGRPPQEMPQLAALLNGIFYEFYPNSPWGLTDRDGLLRLLENQTDGYLRKAKGRTWSVCTNVTGDLNNFFCLLSSLLADCLYTELQGNLYHFAGWTLDVDPGGPTGAVIIEGDTDSTLTVRRQFEQGEVRMDFNVWGGRQAYTFEALATARR